MTQPTTAVSPNKGFIARTKERLSGSWNIPVSKKLLAIPAIVVGGLVVTDKINDHTDIEVVPGNVAGNDGWQIKAPYGDAEWDLFDNPLPGRIEDLESDIVSVYEGIGQLCLEAADETTSQSIAIDAQGNITTSDLDQSAVETARELVFNDCVAVQTNDLQTAVPGIPVPEYQSNN